MKNKLTKFITTALFLSPFAAFAQSIPALTTTGENMIPGATSYSFTNLVSTANTAVNLFISVIILASILLMIWGGFTYVISAGDPDKVKEAKNRVIYGIIGIGVMILAAGVFNLVGSFLGSS